MATERARIGGLTLTSTTDSSGELRTQTVRYDIGRGIREMNRSNGDVVDIDEDTNIFGTRRRRRRRQRRRSQIREILGRSDG